MEKFDNFLKKFDNFLKKLKGLKVKNLILTIWNKDTNFFADNNKYIID